MRSKSQRQPPAPAYQPRPGLAQLAYSGGGDCVTATLVRLSSFRPSLLFPCNGIRPRETAFAGASLPPGTGRGPRSRPPSSGREEGIPCRLPLPEGVRAAAPSPVPAAARAPVGAASEGVRVGVVDPAAAGRVARR